MYSDDYTSVEPIKAVSDKYNVCILMVHHLRKMIADDIFETVSGSTGLTGSVDSILVLQRDRARVNAVLSIVGRDIQDRELALNWNADNCEWEYLGGAAEFRISSERQAIIDELKAAGRPLSSKELADLLGKNHNTLRYNLMKMYNDRQIDKTDRGQYIYINTTDTTSKHIKHIQQAQQIQQESLLYDVVSNDKADTTNEMAVNKPLKGVVVPVVSVVGDIATV